MCLLFGEAAGPEPVDEYARAIGFGRLFVDAFESDSQGRCSRSVWESGAVAAMLHGGEFFVTGPGDC